MYGQARPASQSSYTHTYTHTHTHTQDKRTTALIEAVKAGSLDVVQMLVEEFKANLMIKDAVSAN